MKRVPGIISIALFSISLAACGGGSSDCDALGKHFFEINEKQLAKEDGTDEEIKLAKAVMPAVKDLMVKKCKEEKWPEKYRKCMLGAKDRAAMMKCGEPLADVKAPKELKEEEKSK